MLQSMTGFGRGQVEQGAHKITVEIRSLNHRYCDVRAVLPPSLVRFASSVERKIKARFSRGRLEANVSFERTQEGVSLPKLDISLAQGYLEAYTHLAKSLQIDPQVDLHLLLDAPGVVTHSNTHEEETGLEAPLLEAIDDALTELERMRITEGMKLRSIILERIAKVNSWVDAVTDRAPESVEQKRIRLEARISELTSGTGVEPGRLAQEVALLVDRMDVAEEVERMRAHIEHMDKILKSNEPVGRKLDFLVQEMNREANTIGSKCSDALIAHAVVEMKAELERLREQIQNIE